jgi:DNA-binding response OmpR family regulator/two-component sensor histidine kinase
MGLSVAAFVHEAGQPLTAIKASLQLAKTELENPPELLRLIDRAISQADRAECLFSSMRDYLRPTPKRQELVDLPILVERIMQTLSSGISSRGVSMELRHPDDSLEVIGDPVQVEQLIFNLVNNAKDAVSEAGGGLVLVTLEETPDHRILLLVADDGVGITPRNRERVLEPFFTTKQPDQGTGLGLYVVQRIAESMGAKFSLLPGSAFVSEPLSKMSTVARVEFPGASRVTTVPPLPELVNPNEPHVLVVDDEEAIAALLGKALSNSGLKVTIAHNGDQAVAALEREYFDVLITDKNLPGLSGLDIARLARSFNPRMTVLIITAFPSEDSACNAASLGVSEYITKPFDLEAPVARVRQLLEKARSRSSAPAPIQDGGHPVWTDVPIVIVDPDDSRRSRLSRVLASLGARLVAFSSPRLAGVHLKNEPFSIVAAPTEIISGNSDWFRKAPKGLGALGAIVLMDSGGVNQAIKAIQLGARGMLSPPFNKETVEKELKRAVERLIEEKLGVTPGL